MYFKDQQKPGRLHTIALGKGFTDIGLHAPEGDLVGDEGRRWKEVL